MKIQQAIEMASKVGRDEITRDEWSSIECLRIKGDDFMIITLNDIGYDEDYYQLTVEDVMADDWSYFK